MKFSLIIPCYNEADSLPELIKTCVACRFDDRFEIVIVDNGSTDSTADILPALIQNHDFFRSVKVEKNMGYGFGILSGLKAATGDILGWTHSDLQTNPADIKTAIRFFDSDSAVFAKGRRFGRPLVDVAFTIGMSVFEMLLLHRIFWDINAQPTVFPRSFFETWEDPPHDFSLDLYAYYMAKKKGLRVKRFPVFFGLRKYGVSHWNVNWSSKWKFIRRTIDFSLELKRKYQ